MSHPPDDTFRRKDLEARLFEALLHWPERLDEMETRNEASCRRLAARLAEIAFERDED